MVSLAFLLSASFYHSVTLLLCSHLANGSLLSLCGFENLGLWYPNLGKLACIYSSLILLISVVVSDTTESGSSSCIGSGSCALTGSYLCCCVSCVLGHSVLQCPLVSQILHVGIRSCPRYFTLILLPLTNRMVVIGLLMVLKLSDMTSL